VIQKTELFTPGVLVQDVRFLQGRTLYGRTGDLVAWMALAVTLASLLASTRVRDPARADRT
jgi:apolipoprotein N-acyltransferase